MIGCRAEVLVECDGNVGDSFYLSSGYLKSFGSGCAATFPSAVQTTHHSVIRQDEGSLVVVQRGSTC